MHFRTSPLHHRIIWLLGAATLAIQPARAQVTDTTRVVHLDPMVVTAQRVASSLSTSTAGVSIVAPRSLRILPSRNASGLLGLIPGMTFLDPDGLGYAPQAVTRGFYGGGEAEYVILLVDGRPVNNLENGLLNWEQLVLEPGSSIEVLRGGASSLYGDAAIGAVLNIRTPQRTVPAGALEVSGGTEGVLGARANWASSRYSLSGAFDRSDGYRAHSARRSGTLGGSFRFVDEGDRRIAIDGSIHARTFDAPGPLRSTDASADGRESLGFFRFDTGDERTGRLGLAGSWRGQQATFDAALQAEVRNLDLVRTLPLSADFADTQEREVDARTVRATAMVSDFELPIPIEHDLVIGADLSLGDLDSRYFAVATGGLGDAYAASSGERGELLSDGSAMRLGAAGYAHLDLRPTSRIEVSVGGRYDRISDDFEEVAGLSEPADAATHTAFSPKAGVNLRYASTPTQVGNVYVSASRSFKAPTLDQLYDLRAFPVPFPPFAIRIANPGLVPQSGTSYEAGVYHRMQGESGWDLSLSASAYTTDMTNEIDFSFETFSNVNIGKSRHRGLEMELRTGRSGANVFGHYTLQDVTHQAGENLGNAVKAIPKHAFSVGVEVEQGPVTVGLVTRGVRDMWIDDANTMRMPDYTTVDLRLGFTQGAYRLTLDLYNALDRRYDTTAYPDPGGSDVLFLFPGAMRTISLGLRLLL